MTRKKKARPAISIGVTIIYDDEPSPEWRELMRSLLTEAAQQAAELQMLSGSLSEPHTEVPTS
jgi:hypothetical protein